MQLRLTNSDLQDRVWQFEVCVCACSCLYSCARYHMGSHVRARTRTRLTSLGRTQMPTASARGARVRPRFPSGRSETQASQWANSPGCAEARASLPLPPLPSFLLSGLPSLTPAFAALHSYVLHTHLRSVLSRSYPVLLVLGGGRGAKLTKD